MSQVVLVDTDFLSAFLKIERLELVRDFYGAESLTVPLAVYRELSTTDLVETLSSLPWITVRSPDSARFNKLLAKQDLDHLGTGGFC